MALRSSALRILSAVGPLRCSPARTLVLTRAMATAPPAPRSCHLLTYAYVPDIVERRGPFRVQHLGDLQKLADTGKVLLGGGYGNPVEGGLIVWEHSTVEEIEAFAKGDIYNINGLITSWTVEPYIVGVGPSPLVRTLLAAATPDKTWTILQYNYVPNIEELRKPVRAEHLEALQAKAAAGKIVLAGPFGEPLKGGCILWLNSTDEEIHAFAKADKYNASGLLTSWTVKPYMVGINSL